MQEFQNRVDLLLEALQENVGDDTVVVWCGELPIGKNPNGNNLTFT